jgi:hypothetical protein
MKPLLKARKGGLLLRFTFAFTHFGATLSLFVALSLLSGWHEHRGSSV